MKMKKIWMVILGAFLIQACGAKAAKVAKSTIQEEEKVVLLDFVLQNNLELVKHRALRTESGQLKVQVEIENKKNDDLWTDVQVVFRDVDGFEVEKSNWQPVRFQRRAVTSFERNSLSAKAEDFRVIIRNTR